MKVGSTGSFAECNNCGTQNHTVIDLNTPEGDCVVICKACGKVSLDRYVNTQYTHYETINDTVYDSNIRGLETRIFNLQDQIAQLEQMVKRSNTALLKVLHDPMSIIRKRLIDDTKR